VVVAAGAAVVAALVVVVLLATREHGEAGPAQARSPLGSGRPVTLAFGGDVHFEDALGARLAADPRTALAPLRGLLRGADVSVVNLETAITADGGCPEPQPKQYVFAAPASAFAALRGAGVTAATMANNHGLDCGRAGLAQSLAAARAARFPLIGVGANERRAFRSYRVTVRGQRIAILAASQVVDYELADTWVATPRAAGMATSTNGLVALATAVRDARRNADTVVVVLHWGTERAQCPNAVQPSLARFLADAGADVVVGSHAHVLLGAGYLGRTLVAYGLGNLAFYATSAAGTDSGVLAVTVTGRRVDRYRWRPARIVAGVPVPLQRAEADAAKQRWRALRGCTGLRRRPGGPLPGAAVDDPAQ
jgi:poly-gamma-glutamate capsule biosynthesis protein CapA/YwtB (metallophosphatase superfamily)